MSISSTFSRAQSLYQSSWSVIKNNKRLLLFPIIAAVCCCLIVALFVFGSVAGFVGLANNMPADTRAFGFGVPVLFFLCYVVCFFIMTFFNAAFMFATQQALQGGQVSLRDGMRAASKRFVVILAWSIVAATIGMIFHAIERRSGSFKYVVSTFLGAAWGIIAFLAIPVMVFENQGPFSAMKKGLALLKKTWGEGLIINTGLNLIVFLLFIPFLAIAYFAFSHQIWMLFGLAVICMLAITFLTSAIRKVVEVVIYDYAKTGEMPNGFSEAAVNSVVKRRKGIFGRQ